jgi:hypothetical protein
MPNAGGGWAFSLGDSSVYRWHIGGGAAGDFSGQAGLRVMESRVEAFRGDQRERAGFEILAPSSPLVFFVPIQLRCREWAPKLAPSPLSMRVVTREGGRRSSRRLNDAPHSGAQRGMRRARWPASRRKETSSFTNSILLPTFLYFIPSVIAEEILHRRRDPSSQLQPLV